MKVGSYPVSFFDMFFSQLVVLLVIAYAVSKPLQIVTEVRTFMEIPFLVSPVKCKLSY